MSELKDQPVAFGMWTKDAFFYFLRWMKLTNCPCLLLLTLNRLYIMQMNSTMPYFTWQLIQKCTSSGSAIHTQRVRILYPWSYYATVGWCLFTVSNWNFALGGMCPRVDGWQMLSSLSDVKNALFFQQFQTQNAYFPHLLMRLLMNTSFIRYTTELRVFVCTYCLRH